MSPIFGHARIVLLLIVHMLLGYRELRHLRYYQNDPLVCRLLGLKHLPDVATVSRALSTIDNRSVNDLQALLRTLVLDRIQALGLRRLTLDFDGSVIGTCRSAEGTAVGFNKKKKGQRSELLSKVVFKHLSQAATWFDSVTSIPSLNFTPLMTLAR